MAEIEGGRGGGCPPKATKNYINFLGIDPRLAHLSGHCWALPPHRKILATPLMRIPKVVKNLMLCLLCTISIKSVCEIQFTVCLLTCFILQVIFSMEYEKTVHDT